MRRNQLELKKPVRYRINKKKEIKLWKLKLLMGSKMRINLLWSKNLVRMEN